MIRLTYVKGDDINEFIQEAGSRLTRNGYVVLRIEPGDATRYDLVFTELPRDYVVSLINLNRYTALIGKSQLEIGTGCLDWAGEINICTDGLVCEVYNSIRAGKALGKFFDWEVGHYMG
ncbi:hypothetical protein HN803_02930 [candidate division WWE3 bacterium]|jgi:hypothetical protein|nr:hypothetical protein [Candidatus Scalindua sp.]MBT7349726.1 hypothetical protein [candidate division WWE3 bacterium]